MPRAIVELRSETKNQTIDGTWQNRVLPQDVQLTLAMPRLASHECRDDQGATPVHTIWPCLAVQAMCYSRVAKRDKTEQKTEHGTLVFYHKTFNSI